MEEGASDAPRPRVHISGALDPDHGALVRVTLDNPDFRKRDPHLSGDLGIGVPRALSGLGILDTGASMSCVVGEAASHLALLEVDAVALVGVRATHDRGSEDYSRVRFGVVHLDGGPSFSLAMAEIRPLGEIAGRPLLVLVGRDVLDRAVLDWDGPAGTFALRFPSGSPSGPSG